MISISMNNKTKEQTFSFLWKSIPLEIIYTSDYAPRAKEILGYRLAHLQVMSKNRVPFPLTKTGYHSHFNNAEYIEGFGSPIDFVKIWLSEAEQSDEWKNHLKKMRKQSQLNLF